MLFFLIIYSFVYFQNHLSLRIWSQEQQPQEGSKYLPVYSNFRLFCWIQHTKTGASKVGVTHSQHLFLDEIWTAFPWMEPAGLASPIIPGIYWTYDRTNVVGIPLIEGEGARCSGLYELHSWALFRDISHRELFETIPSLLLALEVVSFQPLFYIHDYRWGSEQRPI